MSEAASVVFGREACGSLEKAYEVRVVIEAQAEGCLLDAEMFGHEQQSRSFYLLAVYVAYGRYAQCGGKQAYKVRLGYAGEGGKLLHVDALVDMFADVLYDAHDALIFGP